MTAWRVEFLRYRSSQKWKRETVIVVCPDEDTGWLQEAIRVKHPEATVQCAERIGPALVADAA